MSATGRVANKVAIVTGAGSGIGRAVALMLAAEGAAVAVADIAVEPGEQATKEIIASGGQALFVKLDVADEAAWQSAMTQIIHTFGRLDVAVNNAGVSLGKSVADMTLVEWRRVMQINLDGVFLGTKHAILAMKSGPGSIVNVASASGIKASAGASAYCASKAAVRMFSKAAALECAAAGTNIRVNVVSPGGVKTPIWEQMDFWPGLVERHGGKEGAWKALAGSSAKEFFTPEEIAKSILFLASDESTYLNAAELVIDHGYSA
jgi:3(or 17)beta-hydroxysteroid dehydrogenase